MDMDVVGDMVIVVVVVVPLTSSWTRGAVGKLSAVAARTQRCTAGAGRVVGVLVARRCRLWV